MNFTQNSIVGLVFFLGLGLLLYFTVIADPELMDEIFGPETPTGNGDDDRYIEVTFSDAGGMSAGTPVKANGMKIGAVRELKYQPKKGKVVAKMEIWEDLYLYKGHEFVVKPESALGGTYVDVNIGDTETEPLPRGEYNEGRVQPDALSAVSDLVSENRADFRAMIANLRKTTTDLAEARGTMGKLIAEREAYDALMMILDDVKATVELVRHGEGTVSLLLNERKLYDDVAAVAENAREISDQIRSGRGTAGELIYRDEISRKLEAALDTLQATLDDVRIVVADARAGKGTIGKLLVDPSLFDNFNEAARNIADVSGKLNRGEGTLGKLLTDDQLYAGLLNTVANVEQITDEVNRGKGTIGKLVKDETLYFELRKAVRSITASVEDAREQAPVSLFTSIIFNAF